MFYYKNFIFTKLIFACLLQLDGPSECYGKGLVQYVKYVLFHGDEPLEFKQVSC